MTSQDIRNVTFDQARRGYNAEDVDDFLQKVADSMDALYVDREQAIASLRTQMANEADAEAAKLRGEKEDLEKKLYILAQKVEEYRGQEDTLKTALINAQRMGETVVHEAKQKADSIMRDANGHAELLRQQAEQEIEKEQSTLERLKNEVNRFRSTILSLYKQHIESLSALDAPTERAADVLEHYSDTTAAPPQPVYAPADEEAPLGDARPEIPDNKQQAVVEAGIDTTPPDPASLSSANLFEGVPLDREE